MNASDEEHGGLPNTVRDIDPDADVDERVQQRTPVAGQDRGTSSSQAVDVVMHELTTHGKNLLWSNPKQLLGTVDILSEMKPTKGQLEAVADLVASVNVSMWPNVLLPRIAATLVVLSFAVLKSIEAYNSGEDGWEWRVALYGLLCVLAVWRLEHGATLAVMVHEAAKHTVELAAGGPRDPAAVAGLEKEFKLRASTLMWSDPDTLRELVATLRSKAGVYQFDGQSFHEHADPAAAWLRIIAMRVLGGVVAIGLVTTELLDGNFHKDNQWVTALFAINYGLIVLGLLNNTRDALMSYEVTRAWLQHTDQAYVDDALSSVKSAVHVWKKQLGLVPLLSAANPFDSEAWWDAGEQAQADALEALLQQATAFQQSTKAKAVVFTSNRKDPFSTAYLDLEQAVEDFMADKNRQLGRLVLDSLEALEREF